MFLLEGKFCPISAVPLRTEANISGQNDLLSVY